MRVFLVVLFFVAAMVLLVATFSVCASVDFDGVDDLISVSDTADLDIIANITIAFWCRPDSIPTTAANRGFNHYVSKWNAYVVRLMDQDTADGSPTDQYGWAFTVFDPTERTIVESTSDADPNLPTLGEWVHVAGVHDGSSISIWENGIKLAALSESGNWSSVANDLMIGNYESPFNGTQVDGQITEVAIWKNDLTGKQLRHLADAQVRGLPLQIDTSNLIGYWPLDDEADGTSADGDTFLEWVNAYNGTGDDGANNTGLTAKAEEVITYQ